MTHLNWSSRLKKKRCQEVKPVDPTTTIFCRNSNTTRVRLLMRGTFSKHRRSHLRSVWMKAFSVQLSRRARQRTRDHRMWLGSLRKHRRQCAVTLRSRESFSWTSQTLLWRESSKSLTWKSKLLILSHFTMPMRDHTLKQSSSPSMQLSR